MNPIQKAWLKVLSPFSCLINEKLAKRPGFLGKLGKWFMIGPREFGYHPLNRGFIYLNDSVLFGLAGIAHRYSYFKYIC